MSSSSSFSSAHSPRLIPKRALVGHSDVITALVASGAHNVLISGSRDRTAIVWHLTRLLFIRQLPGPHPGPVTAVAVNEAKGDIATASGQWLFLWTINGAPLAVVNTLLDAGLFYNSSSIILCIAFSTANDWDENNVVICGTSDGLVKIYSCYRPEQPQQQPAGNDEQCRNVESERQRLNSTSLNDQEQSVREHLLRRSMRIQQHHSHHYSGQQQQRLGGHQQKSIASDTASVTSEASSPISSSFSRQSSQQQQQLAKQQQQQQPTNSQQQQQIVPVTMESIKWIRALKLRRILSEYTAFHAGNAQPAPITAIRPTKDHRSLLVGDGIGRIWMWTICGNAGEPSTE